MAETGKRKANRVTEVKLASLKSNRNKIKARQKGFGFNVPPEPEFVAIYFDQQGQAAEAERFHRHYQDEQWKTVKGVKIRNWKVLAAEWIYDRRQEQKRALRLLKFNS